MSWLNQYFTTFDPCFANLNFLVQINLKSFTVINIKIQSYVFTDISTCILPIIKHGKTEYQVFCMAVLFNLSSLLPPVKPWNSYVSTDWAARNVSRWKIMMATVIMGTSDATCNRNRSYSTKLKSATLVIWYGFELT